MSAVCLGLQQLEGRFLKPGGMAGGLRTGGPARQRREVGDRLMVLRSDTTPSVSFKPTG